MSSDHSKSSSYRTAGTGESTATDSGPQPRRYTYSRKRWNAFEAWQEHIRRSAADIGTAFQAKPDRDLRRVSVPG